MPETPYTGLGQISTCPYYGGPRIRRGLRGRGLGQLWATPGIRIGRKAYYGMSGLGVDIRETLATAGQAVKTTEEILPAVEQMAADYQKASPLVNFLIDYWPIAVLLLSLTVAGGAAAGSMAVLKRLERSRR